ncbi:MAG: methyltransferase domain-containing protein [Bdellovibrionaceae bacterium]|nr:methyltransferase domain-containing protein [Pseudobdellovibrionaceae bacterium]
MRNIISKVSLLGMGAVFLMCTACTTDSSRTANVGNAVESDPLKKAVASPNREAKNAARDVFRHPYETLSFFEVKPDMSVLEITPGQGWYTEILGPYLKEKGTLYLAIFPADNKVEYFQKANVALKEKIANNAGTYGKVVFTEFQAGKEFAPKESVDRVLTFRNVHNWDDKEKIFKGFYEALKPGGILGVVDHRAQAHTKDLKGSGYVKQADVIRLAEQAGFQFIEASEINANAKDTTNHPKGVWTLPPSLRLGDKDREKYLAIGESDRMTLKFKKVSK